MIATEDIIGWDVVNWSRSLEFWESKLNIDYSDCYSLELGSENNGGISLWLALKGSKVVCSWYENVPNQAKLTHKKYGVAELITYEKIDARTIPYTEKFDIIVYKSMLGGIVGNGQLDVATNVIDNIYNALKPNGKLLFAENLSSTSIHKIMRARFGCGGKLWRYFTIPEIQSFHTRFSSFEYVPTGFLGCFGATEKQRRALATLDKKVFEKIIPQSWKYIITGIATK